MRGDIMEEEASRHPGAMAAVIDLPIEKIEQICKACGAEIANINCPGQTVITGEENAVAKASLECQAAGAKRVIRLEVSGGFHSSLMLGAAQKLKEVLDRITLNDASVPIISNYTARPGQKAELLRINLVKQMHSSVRWEESMRYLLAQGVNRFIEFGPGKVLKGLMHRINPAVEVAT